MLHALLNIAPDFFEQVYFNEKVTNYLWFVGIILVTFLIKKPIAGLLTRISSSLTIRYSYMKHKDAIRDMLFKPFERLLQLILFFVASEQLSVLFDGVHFRRSVNSKKSTVIDFSLGDAIDHVFLFLFIIFLALLITHFIDFIYFVQISKAREEKNQNNQQVLPLFKEMSKLFIWTLCLFWALGSVFHVNIPALITGLGIGGVAIALAGKATIENFFAAFTILSDKPFLAGDTIKLGEIEGVVERIGFRSTRLRHTDGSAYIIPNQNLVSLSLINLSMRDTRGIKITAQIRYGISPESLTIMLDELKNKLSNTPPIKEPISVNIDNFDKETMQLVVSYHLPHPLPEGKTLLAVKYEINLMVFEIINKHATLGVEKTGD